MPGVRRRIVFLHTTLQNISGEKQRLYSSFKGHEDKISFLYKSFASGGEQNINFVHKYVRSFTSGTHALKMRFVQFTAVSGGPRKLGVQLSQEGDIIDVSGVDHSIPSGLVQLLQKGPEVLERTKRIVADARSVVPYSSVKLLPPIIAPDKVVCVGLNFRGYCEAHNVPAPKEPMYFSKFSSCITGPFDDIPYPAITKELDWEVELAVVIGKRARNVHKDQAMDHVFGFTVAQDLTARDWYLNRNNGQVLLGKAMDNFCPLGPAVVTKEAIPDVNNLSLRCKVNGVLKQDGNTSEWIHKIDQIVSFFSHVCTLRPGDVILTGTPAAVDLHSSPQFLKPGDVLESEIDGVGNMKNKIVVSIS